MILPLEEVPEYVALPLPRDHLEGILAVRLEVAAAMLAVALVHNCYTNPNGYLPHPPVPAVLLLLDLLNDWSTEADLGTAMAVPFFLRRNQLPYLPVLPF